MSAYFGPGDNDPMVVGQPEGEVIFKRLMREDRDDTRYRLDIESGDKLILKHVELQANSYDT